jgi:hypothetical protein
MKQRLGLSLLLTIILTLTGCAPQPIGGDIETLTPPATVTAPAPTATPTATETIKMIQATASFGVVGTAVLITLPPPGADTPAPGALYSPEQVTLDDAEKTVMLNAGDRFALVLGENFDWTVSIGDETILSRVKNIQPIKGSQGVYEAHKAGKTTLMAVGDPPCRKTKPPCMMPSRAFEIQITVK